MQELFGQTLTFSYDAVGNQTVMQDSKGGVTTSVFDADRNLSSRQFGGSGQTPLRVNFSYNAANQVQTINRYSNLAGTVTVALNSYSYDNAGRLTNLHQTNGSYGNISNYTYTYDAASNVTSETLSYTLTSYTYNTVTSYTYDNANQLLSDGTNTQTYDATGNRTDTGYATGTGNQLQTATVGGSNWAYSYDNEGNLTKKTLGLSANTWVYGYDNANHLMSAKDYNKDPGAVHGSF